MEGTSSVLLDCAFSFFVYNLPQSFIYFVFMYGLFWILSDYSISKYVRKYYFFKCILAIFLCEQNLGYFVFVCFSHIQNGFTFRFTDKLALIFTVLFMFCLIFFVFSFYLLVFIYLGKKSSHFIEFTFPSIAGFNCKTIQFLVRNILRSAIYYFFHYQYKNLLIALALV